VADGWFWGVRGEIVTRRGRLMQIVNVEGLIFLNCHTIVTRKFGGCGVY
jgi:hypothetical protein